MYQLNYVINTYITDIDMSPLSNDKLISLFNSKVDNLTEIVTFQTNVIQELKRDNERLGEVVKSELSKNSESIKVLPAQIHNISELENNSDNNNGIIFCKSSTDEIINET